MILTRLALAWIVLMFFLIALSVANGWTVSP